MMQSTFTNNAQLLSETCWCQNLLVGILLIPEFGNAWPLLPDSDDQIPAKIWLDKRESGQIGRVLVEIG